jgi:hypothetical protein
VYWWCSQFVKTDEKTKQLALNIIVASASVAISTELTSRNNHKKANEQLADITTNHTKEWQVLNSKFEQQSKVLKETETLRDDLQQEFYKASDEIILRNQTIEILQSKVNQLVVEFEAKTQELDFKLQQEHMRYQELIDVFKGLSLSILTNEFTIFSTVWMNQLTRNCQAKTTKLSMII